MPLGLCLLLDDSLCLSASLRDGGGYGVIPNKWQWQGERQWQWHRHRLGPEWRMNHFSLSLSSITHCLVAEWYKLQIFPHFQKSQQGEFCSNILGCKQRNNMSPFNLLPWLYDGLNRLYKAEASNGPQGKFPKLTTIIVAQKVTCPRLSLWNTTYLLFMSESNIESK